MEAEAEPEATAAAAGEEFRGICGCSTLDSQTCLQFGDPTSEMNTLSTHTHTLAVAAMRHVSQHIWLLRWPQFALRYV